MDSIRYMYKHIVVIKQHNAFENDMKNNALKMWWMIETQRGMSLAYTMGCRHCDPSEAEVKGEELT